MGLGVLVPIAASFLAYLGIYLKVRHSTLVRKRISSRQADHKLSKAQRARLHVKQRVFHEDVKVAHALFRVFVIFLLMWLPVAVLIVMGRGTEVSPVWYILTILLAHGNSSINCVVYAASLESFRDGYMKVLGIRTKHSEGKPWSQECAMAIPSYMTLQKGDSPTCEVTSAGLQGVIGRSRLNTLTSNNGCIELNQKRQFPQEVSVREQTLGLCTP
ncbi:hypothetical protein RvY_07084 [Ramazzottius varieornatus]|uniref:G-protein coupled receptors family 1 profile domain-containing protein n=1 Tax=Ramazzottius varieornatus TaxID=947166 RepID=A0A1D1V5Z9_RAMVA|nr:hypothetical protein RvY_07084 [Ramazzottius varieornatus]